MLSKKPLLSTAIFSTTLLAMTAYADTASRCLELIDKRVQDNVLQLSNCNLGAKHAQTILNYLNTHTNVTELQIDNNPNFGSAGVSVVVQSPTLQTLSITGSNVNGDGYAAIAKSTTLKKLIRKDDDQYSTDAPAQLQGNTSLTSINFENAYLYSTSVKALASINSLEEINLSSNRLQADGASVNAINQLPNLTKLDVTGAYLSDDGYVILASNPRLKELAFGEELYGAGPKTLQAIAKNPSLTKVSMTLPDKSFNDFAVLKDNTSITSLTLRGPINDNVIAIVASMKSLTEVTLILSDDMVSLTPLAQQLPKLKTLNVFSYSAFVDDESAAAIAANKTITNLHLDYLTESAAVALGKSTTLQHISIDNTVYGDDNDPNNVNLILNGSLGELATIPSLVEFAYTGNYKMDKSVATAIASNPMLASVHFNRNNIMSKIAAPAFQVLAQAKNLTDLELSSDDINNAATILLASNTTLQRLSLETVNLSDNGVKQLAKNTSLKSLKLNIGAITATAYNELMSNKNILFIDADINFNPNQQIKKR